MDAIKIGRAIAYLRKRVGYTQKDLASRIGISDKAVSKWERGLSLPDIAYLRKLAILLNTNTDSLLAGEFASHHTEWRGVLIFEDNINGISADTIIYDKPLVYFLLGYYLLVGIRDITIICSKQEAQKINRIVNNGIDFGIQLTYLNPEESITGCCANDEKVMFVYGNCLLYGVDQTRFFLKAMSEMDSLTIMALPKKHATLPSIKLDMAKHVLPINCDTSIRTVYEYCNIPIGFANGDVFNRFLNSESPESFLSNIVEEGNLRVELLDRGFVEINLADWNDVYEASSFFRIVQNQCGMKVYCLEEIAWRRGMISTEQLRALADKQKDLEYNKYILSLCN